MREHYLWNRKWVWILIQFLLALLFSNAKLIILEGGGEVTFLSMVFLFLIGYYYGGPTGLLAAFVFGLIKCYQDYPFDGVNIVAECWDYILGFTLMGFGGFFSQLVYKHDEKLGMPKRRCADRALLYGFLAGCTLRFIEGLANYLIFYYRSDKSVLGNVFEAFIYCLLYLGMETLIAILILQLHPVRDAVAYAKEVATTDYKEDLDSF